MKNNRIHAFFLRILSRLALALSIAVAAVAQTALPGGEITGVVSDPSGAVFNNATVVLNPAAQSDDTLDISTTTFRGRFTFANLVPGIYTITASAPGFRAFQTSPISVTKAAPRATVNIELKIEVQWVQLDISSDDSRLDADPSRNGDAIILRGSDIDALPLEPSVLLQQLQTLAGSSNAEIFVDGFSGQSLPPASTIREIRINQNPYSAQNDTAPINGTIQVFTRPGTDKLHGDFTMSGNDSPLNALNPFIRQQPPYYSYRWQGNLGGPINHRASYTFNVGRSSFQTNTVINAFILDHSLNQTSFSQAVPSPSADFTFSPRLDLQAAKNSTLMLRYSFSQSQQTNAGVGQFALASQGFDSSSTNQFLQALNTQTIGNRIINEIRFQYTRSRTDQTPKSFDPTLVVQGAFTDGGNNLGAFRDNQDRFELQDYVSIVAGKHYLSLGGRLRFLRESTYSRANYNGEFIFRSLDAYQITQQKMAQCKAGPPTPCPTAAEIRAAGGGASQFNLNAGNASAAVVLADEALYLQEDWKLRPNLTLSSGLRFESQNHIRDHADWAPRLGVSWGFDNDKSNHPRYVLRAASGMFYLRLPINPILQAARQNGISQQEYIINSPDFYPTIPSPASLGAQVQSTIYQVADRFHAPYFFASTIGLDRQLGRNATLSVTYLNNRGVHRLITLNVNAPLPGTYNPADPTSGIRPFGGTQNIYQFASEGIYRSNRITTNVDVRAGSRFSLNGNYVVSWHKSNDSNNGFPSNQYNIAADYGRSANDIRHNVSVTGNLSLPRGVQVSCFLAAIGGVPFDITLSQDLNGDSQFNDRPTFATDLTRPSVVATRWGSFDTNPIPGQTIIPIYYAKGPPAYALFFNAGKTFRFGPESRSSNSPSAANPSARAPGKYSLNVAVNAQNLFNHVNLTPPVGVLNSPLFGTSTGLFVNTFPSANRVVRLQMTFRF